MYSYDTMILFNCLNTLNLFNDDDTNLHNRNAWRPRVSNALDIGGEFGIEYLLTCRRGIDCVSW